MGKLVKQLGLDAMGSTFTGPPSHINSHSDFRPLFNEVFVFFFFFKASPGLPTSPHQPDCSWTISAAAAAAKSLLSCPTLCDPIDSSPSGSTIPGILQARILEWVAISFSNAWKWKVKVKLLSRVRLLATPWTAAYQSPPSMGVSRQEYWSGLPMPSPKCCIVYWKMWIFSFKNWKIIYGTH